MFGEFNEATQLKTSLAKYSIEFNYLNFSCAAFFEIPGVILFQRLILILNKREKNTFHCIDLFVMKRLLLRLNSDFTCYCISNHVKNDRDRNTLSI